MPWLIGRNLQKFMPSFRYKAVASDGRMLEGEIEAPSRDAAVSRLQNAGQLPISTEEIKLKRNLYSVLFQKFPSNSSIGRKDILFLTRELATLLQAGLPLDSALKTLENSSDSTPMKNLISSIYEKIRGGASLSEAMAAHGNYFDRLYLSMIRAGEAGGSLQIIIGRIADYLEEMWDLRNSVITTLIYPAILILITFISLFVLLIFVVPQFIPLFEDMGQAVPIMTRIVFLIAAFLKSYGWLIIIATIFGLWLFKIRLEDRNRRLRFDKRLLELHLLGPMIKNMEVARFARTLGTLLNNGVPLMNAVMLARDVVENRVIAELLDTVYKSLEQGQRLAGPIKESGYFPALAVQLIEVGEESGQLESMLLRVADIYDKEVRRNIKRMLTLVEPAIIVLLGGVIAAIILSILLALLGLNDLIG